MRPRTVDELFEQWPKLAPGVRARSSETIERTARLAGPFRRTFGSWTLARMETAQPDTAGWVSRHPGAARYARTIMADAVALGLLRLTPFAGVRVPASGTTRDTEFIPTADQVVAMAAVGDRVRGFRGWVEVQAACGARLGAMASLRRGEVQAGPTDDTRRVQLVRKRHGGATVGRRGKKVTYPGLVLASGVPALERKLALRDRPSDLVWKRPGGGAWDIESVSKVFRFIRAELELPEGATSHCLRRFFATGLVDSGVGWEDVALLLDHVDAKGRPNTEMARQHYARPDRDAAIARAARRVAA